MLGGLGLAAVLTLPFTSPWISGSNVAVYHLTGSAAVVLGAAAADFLLVWLAAAALLRAGERRRPWRTVLTIALLTFLPALITESVRSLFDMQWEWGARWLVLASGAVALALWRRGPRIFSRLEAWLGAGLRLLSLFGLLVLLQLGVAAWRARHLNPPPELRSAEERQEARAKAMRAASPRVLWLVLDELSYAQLFERRYPGLALPNFDALAKQATLFTNAQPSSDRTEAVLPSLLMGVPVDDVSFSARGDLLVHNLQGPAWEGMAEENTAIADADREGYRTGLAGWFNPYCRLLPDVLDDCAWAYHSGTGGGLEPGQSFARTALGPWRAAGRWLAALVNPEYSGALQHEAELHEQDFETLMGDARRMLRDDDDTFLAVHLPVPHPPGVYDRKQGRVTTDASSYVDNLALADAALGRLRAQMEATGAWEGATVLVMGDHGWRQIWQDFDFWTEEDQRAMGEGDFDPRTAYLLKLPEQKTHTDFSSPFATWRTRELLQRVTRGEIRTPEQLGAWAGGVRR